ncbi:unnamed protein product [Clonostachys byssicola]|uniref:Peptidylamidoglycolate lyase n=1 Tax=Clonostachys byssicola TaxID=160290 RepID=A0A9N9XZ01_9HYPO|nr:unnamed protein product [Clonostachys byssicola]
MVSHNLQLYTTLGETRYLVESPWGDFKPGPYIVTDVAVSKKGHVLVLVRRVPFKGQSGPAVIELDPDGRFVREWADECVDAHYITVAEDGRILIVDRDSHVVLVFSEAGELQLELGARGHGGKPLNHPCDVAIDSEGNFFVADGYGAAKIHQFSPDGQLVRSWGERGRAPGQLLTPHGILVLPARGHGAERLLVTDRDANRLRVFTKDGKLVRELDDFHLPMSAEFTSDGNILVNDQTPRTSLLGPDLSFLGSARTMITISHGFQPAPDGSIFEIHMATNSLTKLIPVSDK